MRITKTSQGYALEGNGTNWAIVTLPEIAGVGAPQMTQEDVGEGWTRVRLTWDVPTPVQQDEVSVRFDLSVQPDFWWAPHLAPEDGFCVAQHVFRSPALIVADGSETLVLVPDLDICGQDTRLPWFMDYDAPAGQLWLGMTRTDIPLHVAYRKVPGMTVPAGKVEFGFYVTAYRDAQEPRNPWSKVSGFLWERYGHPLFAKGEPGTVPMDAYVQHVYRWAFQTWEHAVWQEFDLDSTRVGSPCFIVNATQSPNYSKPYRLREFLSVWNQAWFSSLRGASGVMRYAQRTGNADLRRRANLTKEFALAAPLKDGIFPSVYRTEMEAITVDGEKVERSKGWETGYWTNSDRVPRKFGVTDQWYHVLDASWTCLLMLRWYEELEADPRLLERAKVYADKLLALQDADGFFPAWLDPETLAPSSVLAQSPETSMSVTFLLKLAELTHEARYRTAALRAMDVVLVEIVPGGRWEDFETYWSCSQWGQEYVGKRIPRNAMYKQCNFSMFWTAEALLETYRATGEERYLRWGRRTLDELSMTQQTWQPPFIFVPALGGFGVMNFDGEWNDSRQCLFAELFMRYYQVTGDAQLFERGITAAKSAFVMMYCPENPDAKALWEKVWPFFGPADYGFTMENYGHGGAVSAAGEGIGEFTIYDWGNGAAAEARNRIHAHFGDVYIDRARGQGFGFDNVAVAMQGDKVVLTDQAHTPRNVRVVFDDGSDKVVRLEGETTIPLGH